MQFQRYLRIFCDVPPHGDKAAGVPLHLQVELKILEQFLVVVEEMTLPSDQQAA